MSSRNAQEYYWIVWVIVGAFTAGILFTRLAEYVAKRIGVVDRPGGRKLQKQAVPLLGGTAILAAVFGGMGIWSFLCPVQEVYHQEDYVRMVGFGIGALIVFATGLFDDIWTLRPWVKLMTQCAAGGVAAASGVRIDCFLPEWLPGPYWATAAATGVTVVWVVLLTNAMNLCDNMDGLCGMLTLIAALSLLACAMPNNGLACPMFASLAGGATGFLWFNAPPARIYLGDSGAFLCGYVLAIASIMGTYHLSGGGHPCSVLAPVVALAIPLGDMTFVAYKRCRKGQSVFEGGRDHFSHGLVAKGMQPARAVMVLSLAGLGVGLCSVVLCHAGCSASIAILTLVFLFVMLLAILTRQRETLSGGV